MRVRLPEVICDTSFLMHVASGRIRNLDDVGFEVGQLEYTVPSVVMAELERLANNLSKGHDAAKAIRLAKGMRQAEMPGKYADLSIVDHIKARGGYVATVDKELKRRVKSAGGNIVSLHDDCVVLEPSPNGKRLKAERVAVDAMGFGIESASFRDGTEIPSRHGYKNGNVSPPLTISGTPKAAKSLALVMDDPDAMGPAGKVWVHWLLWDVDPAVREMPEGTVPEGAAQGTTDFGEIGYGGPAPPDKRHTYIFKMYALDTTSLVKAGATKAELEKAIKGHVLAEARLTGTYAP